jgi:phage/plasmid-associated DNA primase
MITDYRRFHIAVSFSQVTLHRFALADIPGKTLLTATEQPAGYLRTSHVLNALISGEPIQVEKKYRDPFVLVPRAKIAWVHLKPVVARPCRRLRRRCCWR